MSSDIRYSARRVVIVLDAGTDEGCRTARRMLADGHNVVAVDRHAPALVRILPGHSADDLLLLAADADDRTQWQRVLARATARFGRVDSVIAPTAHPLPLSA